MDELKKKKVRLLSRAWGRTVVGFEDPDHPDFSASGTLVKYKGITFIATAAHVVDACMRRQNLKLLIAAPPDKTGKFWSWMSVENSVLAGYGPSKWETGDLDLGWILVDPIVVGERSHMEPVDAETMRQKPSSKEIHDWGLCLVGVPAKSAEWMVEAGLEEPGVKLPKIFIHHTITALEKEDHVDHGWNHEGKEYPCLSDDIHVEYSKSCTPPQNEYRDSVLPHGYSGGSVWCPCGVSDNQVWTADTALKTAGIAYAWSKEHECILAHSTGRWVTMMDELAASDHWTFVEEKWSEMLARPRKVVLIDSRSKNRRSRG